MMQVPGEIMAAAARYVAASRWSRAWRAARAAFHCARIASAARVGDRARYEAACERARQALAEGES